MKERIFKFAAVLCGLFTFADASRAAARPARAEFDIPFDFIVKRQTLPAGRYSVGRLNAANPDILILKNKEGTIKFIFQAQRARAAGRATAARLTFVRGADGYVLSSVWETGETYGYRLYRAPLPAESRDVYRSGN